MNPKGRLSLTIQRLGILGGTFNPPHVGHLILAETAADELGLDRVFFVPAGNPPHKYGIPRAAAQRRLAMVQLSITGNSRFAVSSVDMDRPGPHYTTDMVQIFQNYYPQAEIFFLMGSDSLRDLLAWHNPQLLIELANLVVMQRPSMYPNLTQLARELPRLLQRVHFLNAPEIEISSTAIVALLKASRSVRYSVCASVLKYVMENRLYVENKI